MNIKSIDWNEVWKSGIQSSMQCMQKKGIKECACYWNTTDNARDYLKNYGESNETGSDRIKKTINELNLTSDSKVLEIGSGPGVLTIPIARKAGHVTVVEPSGGMASVLMEEMEKKDVKNIDLIQKRWEDVTSGELDCGYDVVLASMSLGMLDIRAAVQKMNEVCSGKVHIFWHAGKSRFETLYSMMWPSLYESEYSPGPKSDVLFNVLYSMGIYPETKYFEFEHVQNFSSYDDMVEYFKYEHQMEFNPSNEAFRKYLDKFVTEEDGMFVHSDKFPCMMFRW